MSRCSAYVFFHSIDSAVLRLSQWCNFMNVQFLISFSAQTNLTQQFQIKVADYAKLLSVPSSSPSDDTSLLFQQVLCNWFLYHISWFFVHLAVRNSLCFLCNKYTETNYSCDMRYGAYRVFGTFWWSLRHTSIRTPRCDIFEIKQVPESLYTGPSLYMRERNRT